MAGFNQVFRSVVSESIVGSVAGSAYENGGILIENKFPTDTYVSAQAGVLRSDLSQEVGTFDATLSPFGGIIPPIVASSTREQLDYEEELQREAGRTADYAEGVHAFLEKRTPEFKGH